MRFLSILFLSVFSFVCQAQYTVTTATTTKSFEYAPESSVVFAKMTNALSDTTKIKVDRFIKNLKRRGMYTSAHDLLVVCGGLETSANSLIDWTAGSHNGSLVSSPSWSNTSGFTTNGTSSYINSTFIPNSHFVNCTEADHSFWVVVKAIISNSSTSGAIIGSIGATSSRSVLILQNGSGAITWRDGYAATSTSTYWTFLQSNTMHSTSRNAASDVRYITNGQRTGVASNSSNGVAPTAAIYFGARNNNGSADSFLSAEIVAYGACKRSVVQQPAFAFEMETFLMDLGVLPQRSDFGIGNGRSNPNDAIVMLQEGQSLNDGSPNNSVASVSAELTGPLDARVGYRATLGGAFSLQTFEVGVNNSFSNGNTKFSIEARVLKELSAFHPGGRVVLSKFAKDGTSMFPDASDPGNSWAMTNGYLTSRALRYFHIPTLQALQSEGKNIRLIAYDWYQGQTDAGGNAGSDPLWKANFTAKLTHMIDTIQSCGFDTSQMWVIVHRILTGRYSPPRTFDTTVAADQDAMANFFVDNPSYVGDIAGIIVVNDDDLINDTDEVHETIPAVDLRAYRVARFIKSKL